MRRAEATRRRTGVPARLGLLAAGVAMTVACALGGTPSGEGTPSAGGRATSGSADATVRAALSDVERYWSATYPQLSGGRPFQRLRGGYHPYTRTHLPPACGQEQPAYEPNAFYCPDGDFIAWDSESLLPELDRRYGKLLVGVVVAHEYGHAIQVRLGLADQPTIVVEQQADCFAGAWLRDVDEGHAHGFDKPGAAQLDDTLAGILQLRDEPGTSAVADGAHGNAFDRVRALQDGFDQGARRCAGYRDGTIPVTEVPFSSTQDQAAGGDLPYGEAITALGDDAQAYWSRTFPTLAGRSWDTLRVIPYDPARAPACGGQPRPAAKATDTAYYCAADGYIAFDNRGLGPALYEIGDNAVGMLLGELFAEAVQQRRGQPTDGRAGELGVDCLAGSWTHDLLSRPADSDLQLSPGDLDEAVAALLVFGRATAATGADAFDRIEAFRTSVLDGLSACR
jgi:predicted metalloprotease